ncbi:MAG: cobalamin biosynthesis protein, partial [Duncaniella sp.]|nr:cobalamin biosynthesis protein [Duncaniella sp.]
MLCILILLPLAIGWFLDLCFGDPASLPHPVVGFGRIISFLEHRLNNGNHRRLKGGVMAIGLIVMTYLITSWITGATGIWLWLRIGVESILVFYCLAGTTLIREVKMVFEAADRSLEEGRRQVARIVGRDTAQLTDNEIRTAALETLA